MRNVDVRLVNLFCTICLHIHVNGSIWHSHSSEFYLNTWLKYDSIFGNRWSAPDLRFVCCCSGALCYRGLRIKRCFSLGIFL